MKTDYEETHLLTSVNQNQNLNKFERIKRIIFSRKFIAITTIIFLTIGIGIVLSCILIFAFTNNDQSLNIHIKLSQECEQKAIQFNRKVKQIDKNEQIDLKTKQQPHITLYLTKFHKSKFNKIKKALNESVQEFNQELTQGCNVYINETAHISGDYGMWSVVDTDCLQYMSNRIVNKTVSYAVFPQSVPEWVHSIPDNTTRQEKTHYVKKYGSPNVFDQFQPHVTLAHDSQTPKKLKETFEKVNISGCSFKVKTIGMGTVGPFGTVMRGQDFKDFNLIKNK
eukprot:gb/GECH01006642.1/.p1 GENE.gb/GECH01006642.1/~~gb/GECH01006642.1/.p1  ORF type:complete len:281 (+),score=59.19 gb/GECH01006642.1/:1-843(+)